MKDLFFRIIHYPFKYIQGYPVLEAFYAILLVYAGIFLGLILMSAILVIACT